MRLTEGETERRQTQTNTILTDNTAIGEETCRQIGAYTVGNIASDNIEIGTAMTMDTIHTGRVLKRLDRLRQRISNCENKTDSDWMDAWTDQGRGPVLSYSPTHVFLHSQSLQVRNNNCRKVITIPSCLSSVCNLVANLCSILPQRHGASRTGGPLTTACQLLHPDCCLRTLRATQPPLDFLTTRRSISQRKLDKSNLRVHCRSGVSPPPLPSSSLTIDIQKSQLPKGGMLEMYPSLHERAFVSVCWRFTLTMSNMAGMRTSHAKSFHSRLILFSIPLSYIFYASGNY